MRHRNALIALLLVQCVLIALTWWPRDISASRHRPVFDVARDDVVALRITPMPSEGAEPVTVEIEREGEGWVVASAAGYPATEAKVDELLDELLGLEIGRPIARQTSSHNQLHVGEKEFGKRIEIETRDGTTAIVLGAAGRESLNVRFEGESEVHQARGLSEWSIRGDAQGYYDRAYVDVDVGEIATVSLINGFGRLDFRREGEAWSLEQLPEGKTLDQGAVDLLLRDVMKLDLSKPVANEESPEYGLDGGIEVLWTIASEDRSGGGSYRVGKIDGADVYLKASTRPFVVEVAAASVEPLKDAKVSDLVLDEEPPAEAAPLPVVGPE